MITTFIRSDYHNERTEMEKNCRRTRKTKTLEGQLYFTGVYCDCTLPTDGSPYKSDSWVVAQGTMVDFLEMNRRSDPQIKGDDDHDGEGRPRLTMKTKMLTGTCRGGDVRRLRTNRQLGFGSGHLRFRRRHWFWNNKKTKNLVATDHDRDRA